MTVMICGAIVLVMLAVYANHFENAFQFDDFHTIVNNPNIGSLGNIPAFFTDATLFTGDKETALYRPVTSTTLAIDYWLARGIKPFYFHLSTFVWFVVQVILMVFLFRRIMDQADNHPSNLWTAAAAALCYGLHPANAETVNYIIQRADLFNALGVVASLLLFIAYPQQRKHAWYLLPAVAAMLAKAPALIFPLILVAYVFLFEKDADGSKWRETLTETLPAWVVTVLAGILTWVMTPANFNPGASSPWLYRLTQPWVMLRYFRMFFVPVGLTADTDWKYAEPFSLTAIAGYLFLIVLVVAAVRTVRNRETRPIAFGLIWFLVTLLPTSLMALAEVTNDHRMFFPFVGLVLAVFWTLRLVLFRLTDRLTTNSTMVRGALVALGILLALAAAGTWRRNRVWHSEESLWRDATSKSPNNGRAWMNLGVVLQRQNQFSTAHEYFQKARVLGLDQRLLQEMNQYDAMAMRYLSEGKQSTFGMTLPDNGANSPEGMLNLANQYCQHGSYEMCLAFATESVRLRPNFAEGFNTMAAALFSMERWDQGMMAVNKALSLKPDYKEAKSNLEWAKTHAPK
jgi:hypothetical protein